MSVFFPSGATEDEIYLGFWLNRSSGPLRGATLTLDSRGGAFLIAFLALFVGATGRSIWRIVRRVLHLCLSTFRVEDGIYHQRHAILRNSSLAQDAAWEFLQTNIAWRKRSRHPHRQTLPVALVAILISVLSTLAGIFSSRALMTTTNEALLTGKNCGTLGDDVDSVNQIAGEASTYYNERAIEAITYARQCYRGNGAPRPASCDTFTIPVLPYTVDTNASCPFAEEMCKSPTANLLLDTGTLHSSVHFGLNTGPRFTVRMKSHCAPLNTQGFTEIYTDAQNSTKQFVRYKYGTSANLSFLYETEMNQGVLVPAGQVGDYNIITFMTTPEISVFNPIPQLNISGAMTSLLIMDGSEITYLNKTIDPWFSATTEWDGVFVSDNPPSVMGCLLYKSYCNPDLEDTTNCVNSYVEVGNNTVSKVWPKLEDESAIGPFLSILDNHVVFFPDMFYLASGMPSLLARDSMIFGQQLAALPANQWQIEREYIFKASLAAMQAYVVEYARGFWGGAGKFCQQGQLCRRICHSQKIRSKSHYSFSVWVLILLLASGCVIMLVATFQDNLLNALFKLPSIQRNQKLHYAIAEWQANSTLQLQRLAHENLGLGTWSKTNESVPVTEPGDTLGVLDISNPLHSRLVAPSIELARLVEDREEQQKTRATAQYRQVPSEEQL